MKLMILLLLLSMLAGCAAGPELEPVGPDHPASPRAAEAPIRLPAPILSTGEVSTAPTGPAPAPGHGSHGDHP